MNPLLVTVDNFSWTPEGRHNIKNLSEEFRCDIVSLTLNRALAKQMTRLAFERLGSPTWYWDRAVYTFPVQVAIDKGIGLVVYGEAIGYEYGGTQSKEKPSANDQLDNDVVKNVGGLDYWGVPLKELIPVIKPTGNVEVVYLSYFVPWDGYKHYLFAESRGFRKLSWRRS